MYSKEEIRHIAEGLIEELREMPDGTAITSAQLLISLFWKKNIRILL